MVESTIPGEVSDLAAAFVRHWQSLRVDDRLPLSKDFLDRVDPVSQPYVSFNDLESTGKNTVVLFGTGLVELWKVDLTGKEVGEFIDQDQEARLTTDMLKCAEHPCGIWEVSTMRTTNGRIVGWEIVTLPLDLGEPNRNRIVRYHNILESTERGELIQDILYFQSKEWIDVGNGIPSETPLKKAS